MVGSALHAMRMRLANTLFRTLDKILREYCISGTLADLTSPSKHEMSAELICVDDGIPGA